MDLGIRGRNVSALYGGSDGVDLGTAVVGQLLNPPRFAFGARTSDRIREYSVAASYSFRWRNHVSFTTGVQRPTYSRRVQDPVLGTSATTLIPWLYNSSIAVLPTKRLALFGALTRGLEDSGVAPLNATNRGAVLGAARSSQQEIGMKYLFTPSLKLVVTGFEIRKPYFALDGQGVFGSLGGERHRGSEISLAGELLPGLNIVAGAVLFTPEVTAVSTPQDPVGRRPVGLASRMGQLSLDYHTPGLPGFSVDCVVNARGARPASVDNRVQIAGYSTLDVGARYKIPLEHPSMVLRVQVLNVTNSYNWNVGSDGGLWPLEPRRALAYLIIDF